MIEQLGKKSDLNNSINQKNLIDIYIHCPGTAEYNLFSSVCGTYTKIDHILAHKTNLSKLKRIEIIYGVSIDHR